LSHGLTHTYINVGWVDTYCWFYSWPASVFCCFFYHFMSFCSSP